MRMKNCTGLQLHVYSGLQVNRIQGTITSLFISFGYSSFVKLGHILKESVRDIDDNFEVLH